MIVMVPPLLQKPLFQCHFFLSWAFFLAVHSLESAIPPLLPPPSLPPPPSSTAVVPPPSLWPPSASLSAGYLLLYPQLQFRNTVRGNFYLPHYSAFLRTHCQITSSSVFIKKNKILKYKVSQPQLKPALDNCKKKQIPILEMLPDVIRQMKDSKRCTSQTDSSV